MVVSYFSTCYVTKHFFQNIGKTRKRPNISFNNKERTIQTDNNGWDLVNFSGKILKESVFFHRWNQFNRFTITLFLIVATFSRKTLTVEHAILNPVPKTNIAQLISSRSSIQILFYLKLVITFQAMRLQQLTGWRWQRLIFLLRSRWKVRW